MKDCVRCKHLFCLLGKLAQIRHRSWVSSVVCVCVYIDLAYRKAPPPPPHPQSALDKPQACEIILIKNIYMHV